MEHETGTQEIQEKRRHVRRICHSVVDIKTDVATFRGFIKNLSEYGLYMDITEKLSIGKHVELSFPYIDSNEITSLSGKIIHCNEQAAGVEFDHPIRPAQCEHIINYSNRPILESIEKASDGTEHDASAAIQNRFRRNRLKEMLSVFFGTIDEGILEDIETLSEWILIQRGEILFRQGEPGDRFCFLINGRLQAITEDDEGKSHIIGEVVQGESVGEMAVLSGERRSASVCAIRDSQLVQFSKSDFEKITFKYPQVMKHITKTVIRRLRKAIESSATGGKISNVAVFPIGSDLETSAVVERLVKALSVHGSVLRLNRKLVDHKIGMNGAAETAEDAPYNIVFSNWLEEQESAHDLTVYESDGLNSEWTKRCLHQADLILFLVRFGDNPTINNEQINMIGADRKHLTPHKTLLLLHPDGKTPPTGTRKWLEMFEIKNHAHIRLDRETDLERLARIITGQAVGLVLSGGGARGFSHIGAIKALMENDIPIDMIGGTSMGAVIAAQHALEWEYDKKIEKCRETFIKKKPFKDFTLPIISLIKSRKLNKISKMSFGDTQIEDLWINFFCISSNLTKAETLVHRSGTLWKAVRASSSLPGILVPVIHKGNILVDGGVLNNLPGDVMRGMCRGKVILIDVSAESDLSFYHERFPSPWKIFFSRILPFIKAIEVPDILDVLMRTTVLSSIGKTNAIKKNSDFYLHIPVNQFNLMDFNALEEIVRVGYEHTKYQLDQWKDKLHTGKEW